MLGEHWIDIKAQNQCKLVVQTILVLRYAINEPLFQKMTKEKQNMIKWACLLHNISKKSKPTIYGKDHVYPFKSATTVLEIMAQLRLLDIGNDLEKQ